MRKRAKEKKRKIEKEKKSQCPQEEEFQSQNNSAIHQVSWTYFKRNTLMKISGTFTGHALK